MKKRIEILYLAALFALLLFGFSACGGSSGETASDADAAAGAESQTEAAAESEAAEAGAGVELNVSAAASLTDALEEIYAEYQKAGDDVIHFNFAASGTLQKQILEGAPCDFFISASKGHMDALAEADLIVPESRKDLLGNALVLIAAAEKADLIDPDSLTGADVASIAIGEPESVPAGNYAKQSLESLGTWEAVQDKLIFAKDVRQVLEYVETGNADCGFVYRSDAALMETGVIAAELPEESHSPIVYPAALVAGSENAAAAQAFYDYLQSDYAKGVFEKYGFTVL
ncbi:MAG: molybdate ABC transporter substrate-binding protein [Clostridiales Family XIII bacterium]|jgi:molybdate transport system substrate-binding protein|nr:molybdate ABC transporter substrate-binding protein [Clostridiales Family XIII bacterium]